MPKITKLKFQKNGRIVNLYVDDQFLVGLDVLTITKLGLKPNSYISNTRLDSLLIKSQSEKLINKAINYLSYRPRSEKEIRFYLIKQTKSIAKDKRDKLISLVIKKLIKKKLVDDYEFANWWVKQRQTFRPKSKRIISLELRQKGLDSSTIQTAVSEIDELAAARLVATKKQKVLTLLDQRTAKAKLIGFLQRRGFTWEIIKSTVDEFILQE